MLFYRLMGWVAFLCGRMSRYRVNGIPSHFWVILACGMALGIGGDVQLRDAAAYGKPAAVMTLKQALAGGAINQYVIVTGKVDRSITIVGKGNGDKDLYAPMADPQTRQALLVRCQGAAPPATTSVTGVFRQVPSDLYSHLKDGNFQLGPYTVDTEFQLDEGDKPIDPRTYFITLLVAGVPLVLVLLSVASKHIIYQRTPRAFGAAAPVPADAPAPAMRLSGRLALGPKTAQRFLDVPVSLAETNAGKAAFASRINASITGPTGGIEDRAGVWAAVIADGTLRVEDEGLMYLGRTVRPALRVRYTDISKAKPIQAAAVLSFSSEAERDTAREALLALGQQRSQV